jgi:polar amino acid transport system substrate-binding protein
MEFHPNIAGLARMMAPSRARLARLLLILLLAGTATVSRAGDVIVLNTGVGRPYAAPDGGGFLDKLATEAFQRVGRKARVQTYEASERAMINANNGIDDGMALRIKGLETQYPNLLRIQEKVIDNDFVAYSVKQNFPTTDWGSLAPYHVAYILGWKIFELNLPATVNATKVKDPLQLFSLLRQDRTDVILYERWQGLWHAREQGLAVHTHEPPLARQEMFFYLHRKHADLVPKVERALADMKRDGSYQRIFDATLKPLTARR